MVDSYNTILTPGIDEIVEKKSRFIGYAQPVSSEEEAYAFVESVKKNIMMHDTIAMHLQSEKRIPFIVFQMTENRREQLENRY